MCVCLMPDVLVNGSRPGPVVVRYISVTRRYVSIMLVGPHSWRFSLPAIFPDGIWRVSAGRKPLMLTAIFKLVPVSLYRGVWLLIPLSPDAALVIQANQAHHCWRWRGSMRCRERFIGGISA